MDNDFQGNLNLIANLCQLADFSANITQLSNDELMKELIKQDEVLDYQNTILLEQTNIYLKKILENQTEILKLLNKMEG